MRLRGYQGWLLQAPLSGRALSWWEGAEEPPHPLCNSLLLFPGEALVHTELLLPCQGILAPHPPLAGPLVAPPGSGGLRLPLAGLAASWLPGPGFLLFFSAVATGRSQHGGPRRGRARRRTAPRAPGASGS